MPSGISTKASGPSGPRTIPVRVADAMVERRRAAGSTVSALGMETGPNGSRRPREEYRGRARRADRGRWSSARWREGAGAGGAAGCPGRPGAGRGRSAHGPVHVRRQGHLRAQGHRGPLEGRHLERAHGDHARERGDVLEERSELVIRPLRGHGDRDLRVGVVDPRLPRLEERHREAGREGRVVQAPVEGRNLALGRELLGDQLEALLQLDALEAVPGEVLDGHPRLGDLALEGHLARLQRGRAGPGRREQEEGAASADEREAEQGEGECRGRRGGAQPGAEGRHLTGRIGR